MTARIRESNPNPKGAVPTRDWSNTAVVLGGTGQVNLIADRLDLPPCTQVERS